MREFSPERIDDEGVRTRNICKPPRFWLLDLRKPKVVSADVKRNFPEGPVECTGWPSSLTWQKL